MRDDNPKALADSKGRAFGCSFPPFCQHRKGAAGGAGCSYNSLKVFSQKRNACQRAIDNRPYRVYVILGACQRGMNYTTGIPFGHYVATLP